MYWTDLLHR